MGRPLIEDGEAWDLPEWRQYGWLVDCDGRLIRVINMWEAWTGRFDRRDTDHIVDAATAASLRDYHAAVAELAGIVPG